MRDIKFRGISQADSKFVYGWYRKCGEEECIHNKSESHYVVKGTVEQYTGRKDKNDQEICENDLFYDESKRLLKVVYIDRMACFIGQLVSDETLGFPLHFMTKNEIEIIGNIHENKELLNDN